MHLRLHIPGLFGPRARFSKEFLPLVPSLELLVARSSARPRGGDSYYRSLFHAFGHSLAEDRDVPVAALTLLVDSGEPPQGCWMRADPVQLVADRHGLALLDATTLNLDVRDALALAAEIAPTLRAAGWELQVPVPERWYVRLVAVPHMRTRELDSVSGRELLEALPRGANAAHWHKLWNEMQMALHGSGVNAERETRGLPPVNSVWLWGIGELPSSVATPWTSVRADEVFARGLAKLSDVPVVAAADAEDLVNAVFETGSCLAVLDDCARSARHSDLEGWNAALAKLERDWFEPAERLLREGALTRLEIVTAGWRFDLTRHALWKIWRRPAPLLRFAAAE